MTKLATAYYSSAVPHKQVDGLYQATFAIPGVVSMWVEGPGGRPKVFRNAGEAELAGYRMMVSKLNRSRNVQSFGVKGRGVIGIRSFRPADNENNEPTVNSVFGGRKS